jgi:hypothetical protein
MANLWGRWTQSKWWLTLRNKGWGKRGMWGDKTRIQHKIASARGHPHTHENARRRKQIERGLLRPSASDLPD